MIENKITAKISNPTVTRYILKTFGLRAAKRFGQNFLIDDLVVKDIIAAAAITKGERVLEIGPGIGTLTQALLEEGAFVYAIELDKKLPSVLQKTLAAYDHVRIIKGDILKTDIKKLMEDQPFKVVANLPYYITTPLLLTLLEQHLPVTHIIAMVQKEVAERVISAPGAKTYGALSVAMQYYTEPYILRKVAPSSFMPSPKVESAVIVCKKREKPPVAVDDEQVFFQIVRASFGKRRKMLLNALAASGVSKDFVSYCLKKAAIDEKRRGETLSLSEFARLANIFFREKISYF